LPFARVVLATRFPCTCRWRGCTSLAHKPHGQPTTNILFKPRNTKKRNATTQGLASTKEKRKADGSIRNRHRMSGSPSLVVAVVH